MTIQKKILISNIAATLLMVLLISIFSVVYIHFNGETFPKTVQNSSGGINRLTEAMNTLYTYESELSGMKWEAVLTEGEQRTEVMLIPEKQRIEELNNLGYHIQVQSAYNVSFTNLDAADQRFLEDLGIKANEAYYMSPGNVVVRDNFRFAGQTWNITGVYNEERVDKGVKNSVAPLYMVPHGMGIAFFMIAIACITFVSAILSRLVSRTVMEPLQELKKGATMVAEGNLEYRIPYAEHNEFGEVCEEFDRMRIQLKEAWERHVKDVKQQKERLRGITHDLRSPLTSIKGYAMGIRDGIANTQEKRTRYCDAILTRTDDMERLTSALSLLVKMDSGSDFLSLEKVNLDEYIQQLLSEKEVWLTDRKVDVSYRNEVPEAEVNLDIREMQRVFMNLFENTVRYRTKECSRVDIDVRQNSDKVEIRFADDGPGVGSEHLDHIFETLYRADESRTTPEKGSGIGLAIVRRIIEGQGGEVSASSENGLCITMTLPPAKGESRNEENTDR